MHALSVKGWIGVEGKGLPGKANSLIGSYEKWVLLKYNTRKKPRKGSGGSSCR